MVREFTWKFVKAQFHPVYDISVLQLQNNYYGAPISAMTISAPGLYCILSTTISAPTVSAPTVVYTLFTSCVLLCYRMRFHFQLQTAGCRVSTCPCACLCVRVWVCPYMHACMWMLQSSWYSNIGSGGKQLFEQLPTNHSSQNYVRFHSNYWPIRK